MATDQTTIETVESPAEAFRLGGGSVQFAEGDSGGKPHAIKMIARSGEPITHWYWGRIIHDLSGMQLHKEKLPADYCHWEEIGYLDQFDVSGGQLEVAGALVPTTASDDIATKIIQRAKGGVPYEASIDWTDDALFEYVPEEYVTEVNGQEFEGPLLVVREWSLRGVAVCPYGADKNTETKVASAKSSGERPDGGGSTIRARIRALVGHTFAAPGAGNPPPIGQTQEHQTTGPTGAPKELSVPTTTKKQSSEKPSDEPADNPQQQSQTAGNADGGEGGSSTQQPGAQQQSQPTDSSTQQQSTGIDYAAAAKQRLSEVTALLPESAREASKAFVADQVAAGATDAEVLQRFSERVFNENAKLQQRLSGQQAAENEGTGEADPLGFQSGEPDGAKRKGFAANIRIAGKAA